MSTTGTSEERTTIPCYRHPAVAYAFPLAGLAALCLLLDLGWWINLRNFTRAASGPLLYVVRAYDLGINALRPHAILAGVFWTAWLLLVSFTPLRRLPFRVHVFLGSLWCIHGCFATMAI
jgi:hypothetical protein